MNELKHGIVSKCYNPPIKSGQSRNRHPGQEICPTCIWLDNHDTYDHDCAYETECYNCRNLHGDHSIEWLRALKRADHERAVSIHLNHPDLFVDEELSNEQYRELVNTPKDYMYYHYYPVDYFHGVNKCLARYIHKYISHILRDGDCIYMHSIRRRGYNHHEVILYYNNKLYKLYKQYDSLKLKSGCSNLPSIIDITEFGRADYFDHIVGTSYISTRFNCYDTQCIQSDERLNCSLWKVYKKYSEVREILDSRLIPDLTELIIDYIQDTWYVFAKLDETVQVDKLTMYDSIYHGTNTPTSMLYYGLKLSIDERFHDQAKILHTLAFSEDGRVGSA